MDRFIPSPRFCRAVIAFLAVLVWGATVKYDFAWDDHFYIIDNTAIRSLKNIPAMFYSRIAEASRPGDFPNFRPLRNVSYAILFRLTGKTTPQPWIFHLVNILGHAGAALLVFEIASLLFLPAGVGRSRWAALLAAAAFAIHPAVSEVVCWAKSLDDILTAIFILAATRQLLLWHGEKSRVAAALAFFALALYSKESAVPFAALVFFLFRACHNLPWKRCAWLTAPFLLLAEMYILHRDWVLGQAAQCPPISGSYVQTLLDTIPALAIYFRLLWGIPPFSIDYMDMPAHLAVVSISVLTGLGVLVLWAALTWTAWRRERFRLAALGLLWLAFFLLPVSNLVPMMQYVAERFLYLPMIGWVLALGAVAAWAARPIVNYGLAALLAVWIPMSLTREGIWHDEVTLFMTSSLEHPGNRRLHENAVAAVFGLPYLESCFKLKGAEHSVAAPSPISRTEAETMLPPLQRAHQLMPEESRFTAALVITYTAAGQISNAVAVLQSALHHQPANVQNWVDLGTAYALEHNTAKAREAWQTALRLQPTNQIALDHLRALNSK